MSGGSSADGADPVAVERRLAAVLHADIAGYSRLMASDEDSTVRTVRAVRGVVEGTVRQHRGRLVDFTGDACLAEFASAVDAVSAALAIQRESVGLQAGRPEGSRLRLRIGIHTGEVRVEDGTIFGDAIHVAARLQAIAEPDGVTISAAVHEQLQGRLAVHARDLGPQPLKNLGRPVHALALSAAPSADRAPVAGFSGRPPIAVLAFVPFGGDPAQAHLGDGIAEDLITRLAGFRDFPVIARNSSFAYKGRAVDVKQIGRELGVAYLMEGSVQRSGAHVRVTAQLVDARTGHHLWAERYDRELVDVFAIQDEIAEAVVARVYPEVMRAEHERVRTQDSASFGAWEMTVTARAIKAHSREDAERARALVLRALELDPGCAEALRVLQGGQIGAAVNQWHELVTHEPRTILALARRAREVSGDSWQLELVEGMALSAQGDFAAGIAAFERCVRLNPSSVEALIYFANTLARAGRAEEGVALLENARRLEPNPIDRNLFDFHHQLVYYAAGRCAEAVRWGERSLELAPEHASSIRLQICALVELGRMDEARAFAQNLMRVFPEFRVSELERIIPAQPTTLPRLLAALRAVGLPE